MDYFRKYLGPSQGDLQPTGADTVSIINERMSSVINAWETGVYFHFNPIQIKYNNTGTLVFFFFQILRWLFIERYVLFLVSCRKGQVKKYVNVEANYYTNKMALGCSLNRR
jgi:hypothetical protein